MRGYDSIGSQEECLKQELVESLRTRWTSVNSSWAGWQKAGILKEGSGSHLSLSLSLSVNWKNGNSRYFQNMQLKN